MKNLKSFKSLIEKYEYFLFDQWGVLHNGHHKFKEAENCLSLLKEHKKKVILISNSSMPIKNSVSNLTRLGFNENLYDYCITSGQITLNNLDKDIYSKFGNVCYPLKLSDEKIKIFKLKFTTNLKKANFVLIADLEKNLSILDFAELLDQMLDLGKPLVCANPDYMVHDNEKLHMCAGTIAQLYEDMGGRVFRYGKPFKPIYMNIVKEMKIKDPSKALVIGDSLWHDIAGGNLMKFDGLWIKNGIHGPQLDQKDEITQLLNTYKPKYSMSNLNL